MDSTKNNNKHLLFSNGFALSGFDSDEVAAKLSALYKTPQSKISKRLLSGKASKIKSFDKLSDAERLAAKLAKLGLNCYILSPDSEDQLDLNEPEEGGKESSVAIEETGVRETNTREAKDNNTPNQQFSSENSDSVSASIEVSRVTSTASETQFAIDAPKTKAWLNWLLALLFIIILAFAAYYLSTKWLVRTLPSSVAKVETALFISQKPSALIHGDLTQLRRLLSLTDNSELDEKSSLALSKVPLLGSAGGSNALAEGSNALLEATNNFTSSAAFSEGEGGNDSWLTVLQGDYAKLNAENELSKFFVVEKIGKQLLALTPKPNDSVDDLGYECPANEEQANHAPQTTSYAQLGASHIILGSSQAAITAFSSAYKNDKKVEQPQALEWQNYRDNSLFAMSLFDQELLQTNFLASAASSALFGDTSYQSIGVRATLMPIKQAIEVSFDANMNDATIAKELDNKITESIEKLSLDNQASFPAVIALLSRITITSDQALHLTLSVDKGLGNELESLVSDFFSMMFSPSSIDISGTDDGTPPTEELERYSWDHSLNNKMLINSKPPIDEFTKFQPVVVNDGVAIFLDGIGVKAISPFDPEQGDALQLTLKARRAAPFGDAFFGWSKSGIKQSLSITQVLDNNGNSLLIDERCKKAQFSQDLNHQANENTNYSNGVIDTSKTVRLSDSATTQTISNIQGSYSLYVPVNTSVEDLSLDRPAIEWQAGSFTLTEIKGGSVTYILSDQEARLLELRGLNKAGQALSSSSSFSSGKRHTAQFRGEVASIQLVIAGKLEQREFDFNIDNVIPKLTANKSTNSNPVPLSEPRLFDKTDTKKFTRPVSLNKLNPEESKQVKRKLGWQSYSLDASQEYELGHASSKSGEVFFKHDHNSSWSHKISGLVVMPHDESLQSVDGLAKVTLRLDGEAMPPVDISMSRTTVNDKLVPSISVGALNHSIGTFSISFKEKRGPIKDIAGTLEYTLPTKLERKTISLTSPDLKALGLTFIEYDFSWQGSVSYQLDDALAKAYFIKLTTEEGTQSLGKVSIKDGVTTVEFDQVEKLKEIDFYFIKEAQSIVEEFNFKPVYK